MKRYIIFLISILTVVLLTGCKTNIMQKHQENFQKETNRLYWFVEVLKINKNSSIGVVQQKGDIRIILEVQLKGVDIPLDYNTFIRKVDSISINDSRKTEKLLWLKRSNTQFAPRPEIIDLTKSTKVEEKGAFVLNKNVISIRPKWIDHLHQIDPAKVGLEDWDGFMADYDVTKAKGVILTDGDRGKIVILFDHTGKKMREAFVSYEGLDYIRHVEAGQVIDENFEVDPNQFTKVIWQIWNNSLKPFQETF